MLNRIVLIGRLTRDPIFTTTPSNTSITTFSIAVDDSTKDAEGNYLTNYFNIKVFNKGAENVQKSCRKGSLVAVDGRMVQRTYEKKDGTKATTYEVIANSVEFLEPKGKREIPNEDFFPDEPATSGMDDINEDKSNNLDDVDVPEEDIPF